MAPLFTSPPYVSYVAAVDEFLNIHFREREKDTAVFGPQLLEAVKYSLFNGGKRFRPVLSLYTMQGLGEDFRKALPWAAALEMTHTYSLIHDDLPCMDNDDFRRGQPTSHKKFGEALALLAGDALLTESFLILSQHYKNHPHFADLITLLAKSAGASGMVGGQAMDMGFGSPMTEILHTERMHAGKTGALISAAVQGPGWLCAEPVEQRHSLRELGDLIGLAFQIKDDLLDMENDPRSFVYFLKEDGTKKALSDVHTKAQAILEKLPTTCNVLGEFIAANAQRNK